MRKVSLWILCAAIQVIVSGCSWLQSDNLSKTSGGTGLVYYLPMKPVQAVYERKTAKSLVKAQADLVKARAAVASTKVAEAKALEERRQLEQQLIELKKSGLATTEKAYKDLLVAKSKKAVAYAVAQAKSLAAAKSEVKATAALATARAAGANGCYDSISIMPLAARADMAQRFALKSTHAISRSEKADLTTTTSGLLTSLDAEATDETKAAIVSLASTFGAARGLNNFLFSNAASKCDPIRVSHTLDPVSTTEWQRFARAVVLAAGVNYTVQPDVGLMSSPYQASPGDARDAIAYRRDLPLELKVCSGTSCDGANVVEVLSIDVPNHSPTEFLPIAVGTFGSTELDVKFKDGILTESSQTRSSELAEAAKVPFEALKAVGSAISEVFQLRIDQTGKETELSQKELELLEANQALEQALEDATAGNAEEP